MAVVDFYSESNQNTQSLLSSDVSITDQAISQSFTGDGSNLASVELYLDKSGSPTGNAVVKIFAHSGTFGTSSLPTGSALATSDTFDVATLTTSFQLVEFTFSGVEQIALGSGTRYCVVLEYSGGDFTNRVNMGADNTSSTHAGNYGRLRNSVWTAFSTIDNVFYVNGTEGVPPQRIGHIPANINGGVNIRPMAFQPGRAK